MVWLQLRGEGRGLSLSVQAGIALLQCFCWQDFTKQDVLSRTDIPVSIKCGIHVFCWDILLVWKTSGMFFLKSFLFISCLVVRGQTFLFCVVRVRQMFSSAAVHQLNLCVSMAVSIITGCDLHYNHNANSMYFEFTICYAPHSPIYKSVWC